MTEILLETAEQSAERDRYTIEQEGIPSAVLMETAARELCRLLEPELQPEDRIFVVCGPGNNGQDGLAMTRVLREHGHEATPFSLEPESPQHQILTRRNIPVCQDLTEALEQIKEADWIVDAMFGSGLSRPLSGQWATLAQAMTLSSAKVFSVDIPSGIHGTDGLLQDTAVKADMTGAIGTRKKGTILPSALPYCGRQQTVAIGLGDPGTPRNLFLLTEDKARACLPVRSDRSYKGTFGKALVIGGSRQMHGAVSMTARACFHSGIGLLTTAVPACLENAMRCKLDETMLLVTPGDPEAIDEAAVPVILEEAAKMTVVSAGNGMGRGPGTRTLVKELLAADHLLVLDADALDVLEPEWLQRQAPVILTPHVGEFSRITGMSVQEISRDPVKAALAFTSQYPSAVLVLKSDVTVVAACENAWVLDRPDSALAKGGSGDVLCGIITGLAGSQEPLQAALCGVYAHNRAAGMKKDPAGFTPEDLIGHLADVWNELRI